MDYKSLRSDVAVALLAQGISFFLSALSTLVIPKVASAEAFGYWQLFMFYITYVGFFHFGLNDGVYLLNGGKNRDEIDSRSITSQFLVGICTQSIVAVILIAFTFTMDFEASRKFVLVATAFYLVVCNATNYLGFLFQAIAETKLYSLSVVVDKLVFLVPLVILLVTGYASFELYVVFWCVSKICSALYCVWHAKDILKAKLLPMNNALRDSIESIKVGIVLTLANISSLLVLGVLRFAIDSEWDIATFGKVSFAITMVNFFLTMIAQVAMVLFPALRRANKQEQLSFFSLERDALGLILPVAYIFYVPMCIILSKWLPQYEISFNYFMFLLPLCLYDGKMNLISTTFMKVLRMEKDLLRINAIAVLASCICVYIGVWEMHSIEMTIVLVACVIVLRSIYSEMLLLRRFEQRPTLDMLWEALITGVFMIVAMSFGYSALSFVLILVFYLIYLLLNKQRFLRVIKRS